MKNKKTDESRFFCFRCYGFVTNIRRLRRLNADVSPICHRQRLAHPVTHKSAGAACHLEKRSGLALNLGNFTRLPTLSQQIQRG